MTEERDQLDLLRHHGDVDVEPGMLDFAVNVASPAPPAWLVRRLAERLGSLGRYPSSADELAARTAVAARHGRSPDEVLLLAGGAEGFALLPKLCTHAALIHPSFTEPDVALRGAGVRVTVVMLRRPYALSHAVVPDDADLVVLGNPTNPTSVLHPAKSVLALRRPGRIVVVDEAFADAVPGEVESLSRLSLPDVVVLRSLTKTWSLAGLRCGYALGAPEVLQRMATGRPHWPLGTLQLEAIAACCEPEAVAESSDRAFRICDERAALATELEELGISVNLPAAGPFLLIDVADGESMRKGLREKGIAVRRCDTFPGLGPDQLRIAVRDARSVRRLVTAIKELL
ncbi:Rv2231c family pyridoxal phosphate-dependent protein CobC [Antrihabitans sp. YC2-6]|uniref:Rv2231c family pyridoxal phosphate-dependent protein CobC n=1 Tax=Antrihabitans sp. YC2-6 TaxID=2799498 RepID=UPI0027DB285A|nr:Rv2231c family pyridoxal phosphate-dependent protein CobC [Antrihabitans sp. YC2-6]